MDAIKSDAKPILRGEKGYFLPGTAAGPGRPEGSLSIKDEVRKYLETHPLTKENFMRELLLTKRHETWKMLEGAPDTKGDLNVKAKIEVQTISFDDYDSTQPKTE